MNVLIVEDEAINMLYIKTILEKNNYIVLEAGDGYEAIEMADKHSPDCIMMDIGLPRLSGIDAIKEIRKLEHCKDIPIYAVTAHAYAEDKKNIEDAGANGIIIKPYDDEAILDTLKKILS